jgi:hypothetical protein
MADDINKINKEIDELRKQLGQKSIQPFDIQNLQLAKTVLTGLRADFRDMNTDLDYISTSFKNSVQELSKQNVFLSLSKKSLNSISDVSNKILQARRGEVSFTEKQLQNLRAKAIIDFKSLKTALEYGSLKNYQNTEIENAIDKEQLFLEEIENILNVQKEVNKQIGLAGVTLEGLGKTLSKIGFSNLAQPISDAIKKTKDALIQIELNKKAISDINELQELQNKNYNDLTEEELERFDRLVDIYGVESSSIEKKKTQLKEINKELSTQASRVKNIGEELKNQLTTTNLLDFAFVQLVKAFKASDTSTSNIAKNLNMSYSNSLGMKQELTAAANSSGDLFVTSKGMADSLVAINDELGTSVMLNKENLATFTKLRESAGMTNDELMGMQSLVNATGGSYEKMTQEFLGQAAITAKNNKVILNEKKLLGDINKLSAATTLSLGKQPHALSKAVATAKSLGMEMSKIENIADSLLNFEDSISAEMEAELITGKQLNLERARLAAINNDVATVAEEIAGQIGSAAEFSNMNRIAQESLAKAVGMNREELAKTLFIQEQLRGATKEEAKLRENKINKLIKDGMSVEEASLAVGKEKLEDLKNQAGVQDRFNASVEKLKEIFVSIVDVTMPFFNGLANIVGWLAESKTILYSILGAYVGIAAYQKAIVLWKQKEAILRLLNIKRAATLAALTALANPAKAIAGVAAAAIVGAVAGALIAQAGDLNSPAKGKTVVSTKEGGLFELSKNDDLVAAPGLSKTLSNMEGSYKSSPSSNVSLNIEPLIKEIKTMKEVLVQILNKEGTITLNGTKMGTAMSVGTYKIQ